MSKKIGFRVIILIISIICLFNFIMINNLYAYNKNLIPIFSKINNKMGSILYNQIQNEKFKFKYGTLDTNYINFENSDYYGSFDIVFSNKGEYQHLFPLTGSNISIKWKDKKTGKWQKADKFPANSGQYLFVIDSSKEHYVISPIAIYSYNNVNHTRVNKGYGGIYIENGNIKVRYLADKGEHGDLWYISSGSELFSGEKALKELFTHNIDGEKRWCFDGFYIRAKSNYEPYQRGMFFRNPANYVGVSFAKYAFSRGMEDLGYAMIMTGINNQNKYGYWQTDCIVDWLSRDYGIKEGFYDTRFNSDFAIGLIYAYKRYGNDIILKSLKRYAEYFFEYAQNHSHKTANGILIEDYAPSNKKVHTSLNHHLTELNFLYEYYNLTYDDKYLQLANKMLKGLDDTKNYWVMKNHNLAYAYGYNNSSNKMVDYPYLTYNDLYETKFLLERYFKATNTTIEYLMKNKKIWMDKNGITQYRK